MPTASKEVQTAGRPPTKDRWRPWVWLATLAVLDGRTGPARGAAAAETQTDLSISGPVVRPPSRDAATLTAQEQVVAVSEFDRWWRGVLQASDEEARGARPRSGLPLNRAQLLALIASVYAEKLVQDELDDREGRPRLPLTKFLHMFLLQQKGSAVAAERAAVTVVSSIAANLTVPGATLYDDHDSGSGGGTEAGRARAGGGRCERIAMFARFLGLPGAGGDPIPLQGLSFYLAALVRAQRGAVPLLPVSSERVEVAVEVFVRGLDWLFHQTRAVTREAIKLGLSAMAPSQPSVDLDRALEYVLVQCQELEGRADARLEALFSTVVAIGDFEFVQFEEVTNVIETRDFLVHDIRMQISFKGPRIASLKDTGAYHWEMRNSSM